MRYAHNRTRRRDAFTLIELLVVLVLILVIAAIGLGYIVFGQDNQHSVNGAQAVTGALLNAKQRARRDGLPTGVRILFGTNGLPASESNQLELVQQPEDYNSGQWASADPTGKMLGFAAVDFQGGAQTPGEIDESTIEAGDYLVLAGSPLPHRISTVNTAQSLTLDSSVLPLMPGLPYTIMRAPRRLPSEDIVQLPSGVVIDSGLCKNLPISSTGAGNPEIVFAPSGAVVGQGTGADKVYLWLRDPNIKPAAFVVGAQYPGVPLILSVQIRTGLIGVYPVAPWGYNTPIVPGNDPYLYVGDPRSSGL